MYPTFLALLPQLMHQIYRLKPCEGVAKNLQNSSHSATCPIFILQYNATRVDLPKNLKYQLHIIASFYFFLRRIATLG